MYEFLDRLITLAFPRVKDFRGVNPERVRQDRELQLRVHRADRVPGSRRRDGDVPAGHEHHDGDDGRATPDEGRELLKQFGFPFREDDEGGQK